VAFDEKAERATADFSGLISRAAKENCDTIFAVLPGDSLVALIRAARAGSFKGKILVGDTFYAAELQKLGKDADGIHLAQAWSDDSAFKSQ
jgi:ABC-type branched-subunit amino acid transport system substrate-binding protein